MNFCKALLKTIFTKPPAKLFTEIQFTELTVDDVYLGVFSSVEKALAYAHEHYPDGSIYRTQPLGGSRHES
jgi:hypothetical protein